MCIFLDKDGFTLHVSRDDPPCLKLSSSGSMIRSESSEWPTLCERPAEAEPFQHPRAVKGIFTQWLLCVMCQPSWIKAD